jgi:hypothetical protein
MPVPPPLHFGVVEGAPWLDPSGLPGCRRRYPELAGRRGRRRESEASDAVTGWRNIAITVRREKALVHSEKKDSPGNWIAPPGSNRSGGGGNKAAGASDVEGRIRRLGKSAGCNPSER